MRIEIEQVSQVKQGGLCKYRSIHEEEVEDLIYEFIKNHRPSTARSYREDLKFFFNFTQAQFGLPKLEDSTIDFSTIKSVHAVKYKNFLEETPCRTGRPLSPNSVNRRLSSAASFFQFLLRRELIPKNPLQFCTRPKRICVRPTEAMDDREMRDLFRLVLKKAPPMHACVIILLFTSGMRNAEVRNIRIKDFKDDQGVRTLSYIGKGEKASEIAIHSATAYYIDEYLKWRVEQGQALQPDDYLFQSSRSGSRAKSSDVARNHERPTDEGNPRNKKLSATALGYIVKKWASLICPNKRLSPHSARASFISSLLENGADLYETAQAVSHSDCRVTQRYDKRKRNFRKSPTLTMNLF